MRNRQSDRIAEIFAEEGDIVKAGQLFQVRESILLKLKNGTRPEDLTQAQARIEVAQAISRRKI